MHGRLSHLDMGGWRQSCTNTMLPSFTAGMKTKLTVTRLLRMSL